MSAQSVYDLLGEDVVAEYGFVPEKAIVFVPQLVIGDAAAGPENDQPLQVFHDTRPLAVEELGMGHINKVARRAEGRTMPLNDDWGDWFDTTMLERPPEQDARRPSSFGPGQNPTWHEGVHPPEVVRNPHSVYYTATPWVGWKGW